MGASELGAHVESLVGRSGRALTAPCHEQSHRLAMKRPLGGLLSALPAPLDVSHLVIFRRRLETAKAAAAPTSLTRLS